jgi:hypothetical protein
VFGCGVHQNPDKEEQVLIPEKISVDIPKLLSLEEGNGSSSSKQQKIQEEFFGGEATGYQDVQGYIGFLESVIKEIKFNNVIGNTIVLDVQEHCAKVVLDEVCSVPSNTFFLKVDEALIAQYEVFFPKAFRINEESVGKSIAFDEIEFIKHDENHTYQYDIQLDLTQISNALYKKDFIFDANLSKVVQNVKWSEDNNTIFTSISPSYEDNVTYPWTISYQNRPTVEERMYLWSNNVDLLPKPSDMVTFDLRKKEDENETSIYKFNEIKEKNSFGEVSLSTYVAYGELSKTNGFQTFSQTESSESDGESKTKKQEIFTNEGALIASTYCDSYSAECSLYDSSTWYIDNADETLFDFVDAVAFDELNITATNLREGEYFLLPANHTIQERTIQEIIEASVGNFVVFKGLAKGALYDRGYVNDLNTLQVVYARYNNDLVLPLSEQDNRLFDVLLEAERPQITLFL